MPSRTSQAVATKRVRAAVDRLRAYYALGVRARKQWPGPGARLESLHDLAQAEGVSDDHLRKAMQLADPARGYGRSELERLCKRILSGENRWDIPIGTAHIVRLLSFSGAERSQWERRVLSGGWNVRQLAREIARRHGSRKSGGRRPYVATTADGMMADLAGLALRWRRYVAAIDGSPDSQEALPPRIRRHVQAVGVAMDALRDEINREMTRRRPGWQERVSRDAD